MCLTERCTTFLKTAVDSTNKEIFDNVKMLLITCSGTVTAILLDATANGCVYYTIV